MRRRGRPIDPEFLPAEKLFRRYQRTHIVDGELTGVGLSFNAAPSVNRGKYSEAGDVLFDQAGKFAGWGVISWQVQQITMFLPEPPAAPRFKLGPRHAPLEDNYAHSEIHSARVNTEVYCEPDKGIRKILRATLGQRATIEIEAQT